MIPRFSNKEYLLVRLIVFMVFRNLNNNSAYLYCRNRIVFVLFNSNPYPEIPIINLKKWFSKDENSRKEVAKDLMDACISYGFIYIKNHTISGKMINDVFKAASEFFNLSIDQILKVHYESLGYYRGYIPVEAERTNPLGGNLGFVVQIDEIDHPINKRITARNL